MRDADSIFSIQCQDCGGLCYYADDSTYTVQGKDPQQLTDKLSKKYNVMADFLTDNKLKVNDDKTHMLVMTTWQKRRLVDTDSTRIKTSTSTVKPSSTERLLGHPSKIKSIINLPISVSLLWVMVSLNMDWIPVGEEESSTLI